MIREAPEFYNKIEAQARQRWTQLDADPGLAAPWHTLLRQVQNPRLVLSELLQNADDAGATWAEAAIEQDTFVIRHDGRDFAAEEFAALCEFGMSSKRALLTTGFRGIGFKAVFALGDEVEVLTPTIAVRFDRHRFTLPRWRKSARSTTGVEIRIPLTRPDAKSAVLQDLAHWRDNPLPLIFFRNVRSLRLQGRTIKAMDLGPAPCLAGRRVSLDGFPGELILLRSAPEMIPANAAAELAEERGVMADTWPPCEVEVVLGAPGRLYAVLPTDVVTEQPFACQAPFLLDPARTRIKEPVQSPMNRWLLERMGKLVAEAVSTWVHRKDLPEAERVAAYRYLPVPGGEQKVSLTDRASAAIVAGYQSAIPQHPVVVSAAGDVVQGPVTAVPREVLEVWPPEQAEAAFAFPGTSRLLARSVPTEHWQALKTLGHVKVASPAVVVESLRGSNTRLPRPAEIERLVFLWLLALEQLEKAWGASLTDISRLNILPVAGKLKLASPDGALPPVAPPERVPKTDWAFVLSRATIIDERWVTLMKAIDDNPEVVSAELESRLGIAVTSMALQRVGAAYKSLGLVSPRVEPIIAQVATSIFATEPIRLPEAVRLTWIAAKANVSDAALAGGRWRFLCRDGRWRSQSEGILVDEGAAVTSLLPPGSADTRFLAPQYLAGSGPRDAKLFRTWATTKGRGGLDAFPKPELKNEAFAAGDGYRRFRQRCEELGLAPAEPPYKNGTVEIEDSNWPPEWWAYWEKCARSDPHFWTRLCREVLEAWDESWEAQAGRIYKQYRASRAHRFGASEQAASWLAKLRERACLPDEQGVAKRPLELIRRTAETSAFLNIEPVLALELDQGPYYRALDWLGVRVSCRDAGPVIERIRQLSEKRKPPELGRLHDYYLAVMRIHSSYADPVIREQLMAAFSENALVLSDLGWRTRETVYRTNTKRLPGMAVIHEAFQNLQPLWEGLEISAEPKVTDVFTWLDRVQTGRAFRQQDGEALRAVCQAYPADAWRIVWPSLDGKPYRPKRFKWATLVSAMGLGMPDDLRAVIADASMLDRARFHDLGTGLPLIEDVVEQRIHQCRPPLRHATINAPGWVSALGQMLATHYPPTGTPDSNAADRATGAALAQAAWWEVKSLTIESTLEGRSIGHSQPANAAWLPDGIVVVSQGDLPPVDELAVVLSRRFRSEAARHAVAVCIDRDGAWIASYFRQQGWQLATDGDGAESTNASDEAASASVVPTGEVLALHEKADAPADDGSRSISVQPEPTLREIQVDEPESSPPLPSSVAPDISRRIAKVALRAEAAEEKRYERVSIKRRVTESVIAPHAYLRLHHTNVNGDLICQLCDKRMPFKLHGDDYFEAVQFLESFDREIEANYLALCPNCAAEYKYGCTTEPNSRLSQLMALNFQGPEEEMLLELKMPAHRTLRFTQRHLIDLRESLSH